MDSVRGNKVLSLQSEIFTLTMVPLTVNKRVSGSQASALIAQLDRVSGFEPGGQRFKSSWVQFLVKVCPSAYAWIGAGGKRFLRILVLSGSLRRGCFLGDSFFKKRETVLRLALETCLILRVEMVVVFQKKKCCTIKNRDVAQFGSAYALGAQGRRFESCHPEQ